MIARTAVALGVIASAALLAAPIGRAKPRAPQGDDMATVWPAFQAAVAKGDRDRVASLMRFPLQGWDENDLGTEITRDELLKRYARAFTPTVKRGVASGLPKRQDDGSYVVEWRVRGPNPRYTLIFENADGAGFRCVALATGD